MRPYDAPFWLRSPAILAGCLAACALPLVAVAWNGWNGYPPPPTSSHSVVQDATPIAAGGVPTLLTPSQAELDFGTLAKGGNGEVTFWLHNAGASAVEVTRVETSCSCFYLDLPEKTVPAGERIEVTARIDLASDPTFVGEFCPEISGLTSTKGVRAFRVSGKVRVCSNKIADDE